MTYVSLHVTHQHHRHYKIGRRCPQTFKPGVRRLTVYLASYLALGNRKIQLQQWEDTAIPQMAVQQCAASSKLAMERKIVLPVAHLKKSWALSNASPRMKDSCRLGKMDRACDRNSACAAAAEPAAHKAAVSSSGPAQD